ncbi:MAG: coenzyme transferase [Solirubrobacterales bacterium]|nr:coenzyme transferase [Solirubrobacterales bacterium]
MSIDLPSLEDAVASTVADGDCVWIGNFGTQLFAVAEELIRQGRRDLHLVVGSGGILLDRLLAEGVAAEVTFTHCWSPVGPRPTRAFRAAWEEGSEVRFHELPLGALVAALEAGAAGVPFAPVALDPGTGYPDWTPEMIGTAESPFGQATVVRALRPDVAFVHGRSADHEGNVQIGAPAGEAPAAVAAARRTVAVVEQIIDLQLTGVALPSILIDLIVEHPGAAAPDGVPGLYERDVAAYETYAGASA